MAALVVDRLLEAGGPDQRKGQRSGIIEVQLVIAVSQEKLILIGKVLISARVLDIAIIGCHRGGNVIVGCPAPGTLGAGISVIINAEGWEKRLAGMMFPGKRRLIPLAVAVAAEGSVIAVLGSRLEKLPAIIAGVGSVET